jgi:ribonuclease HI
MELLLETGAEAVEIFRDSKLVISQLTEEYRCESVTFPFLGTMSGADVPI